MTSLEWFDFVSNFIGIVTFLAAVYSAWRLWRQDRQLREKISKTTPKVEEYAQQVELHRGVQTRKPVAFALSLIPKADSIRNSVQEFLNLQNWKMPIEELNMDGIQSDADRERFVNALRVKRRLFDEQGVTEIHLFFAGPVSAAVLVGAALDHWVPIKLYHKPTPPPPQFYEYWMPLMK